MRRSVAGIGTGMFLVGVPGTVVGLVPWWITRWNRGIELPGSVRAIGSVLIGVGALVLVSAFVRFVVEGHGTPAPVAPTGSLVVGGLYRHVRNPMYLAVLAVIVGEAIVLGRPVLFVYAAVVATAFVTFVRLYEEPTLSRSFGGRYDEYRRNVPGWWPRLRPWNGGSSASRQGSGSTGESNESA